MQLRVSNARGSGEGITNTRVKDLVDMVLLISKDTLDAKRTHIAI